ncbi:hypothetical protein D3C86_1738100 [compost metagenome]
MNQPLSKAGGDKRRITRTKEEPFPVRLLHNAQHSGQWTKVIFLVILVDRIPALPINIDVAVSADSDGFHLITKRSGNMLP